MPLADGRRGTDERAERDRRAEKDGMKTRDGIGIHHRTDIFKVKKSFFLCNEMS